MKVTAPEGALPEGTRVLAEAVHRADVAAAVAGVVEEQGRTLEGAVALDVTLVDKDGNAIQPNGSVSGASSMPAWARAKPWACTA